MDYNILVTEQDIIMIGTALGNAPMGNTAYNQIHALIQKLQSQVNAQNVPAAVEETGEADANITA